jgi:dienelactone hydrolase
MRHVAVLVSLVLGLALETPAFAQQHASDEMLFAAPNGTALRACLLAYADTVAARDSLEAARALAYGGTSFSRDGEPDSAVALYQRAFDLDGRPERRIALAEALVARLAKGDAERAREILRGIQPSNWMEPDVTETTRQGLFGWAHYLAGRADSAALLLAPVEPWLSAHQEWRYRMACVALERSDWARAFALLTPLAVASRNSDSDVAEMLRVSTTKMNAGRHLQTWLLQEIRKRDQMEDELLAELGARRVSFTASDNFRLAGMLLTPSTHRRPRAAVLLLTPEDTLTYYDSLAVGLRRMGLAVMLLELRGSGRSVGPTCPLSGAWKGRETQMRMRSAADVRAAVTAMAREAKVDTSRYLVIGVGATAPIAVEAARLDPRVGVLLLVSPDPSPVDRGPMRATLAAVRRPVYFQTGPEEFTTWPVVDSLYRACDQRASRIADTDDYGTHAKLFRRSPKILERFRRWLEESWPTPAPRATRPSTPRKG